MPDKRFLVLGGAGLTGFQIARRILSDLRPEEIVVVSLGAEEVEQAVAALQADAPAGLRISGEWGDVFLRSEYARRSRRELLDDDEAREGIFADLLGPMEDAYERSELAAIIRRHRPDVIVDSINTATAISYQDVYTSAVEAKQAVDEIDAGRGDPHDAVHDVEALILSQAVPQLIRHAMVLHRAMVEVGTRLYLKVGTTGTGGMGLNIPYTHSEDRPSSKLMTKTAVAFAHTGLLFLMARTPDGPQVKEVKPAAMIGYGGIEHRVICERGEPVQVHEARAETLGGRLVRRLDPAGFRRLGEMQLPVVNTGENGMFTKGEFEAITSGGQMEFVTPEEIAHICIEEIRGATTGRDVVAALDGSMTGPSYRAGVLRRRVIDALDRLEDETGTHSVALGQLGPPELSKLLWEAELLNLEYETRSAALETAPAEMAEALAKRIAHSDELRNTITSLGTPILMPDGAEIIRGPIIRIPEIPGGNETALDDAARDRWAAKGWVDLRVANMVHWQERFAAMRAAAAAGTEAGSAAIPEDVYNTDGIDIGSVVAWILAHELGGYRVK